MSGWIKLHRELRNSPIFENEKLLKVFIWCLFKATHKPRQQLVGKQFVDLEPGQFPTGRNKAGTELNLPPSTAWDYLKLLEKNKTISIKSNNKFSIVTIENWGLYQSENEKSDNKLTANEQQINNTLTTNEQHLDTNKNDKNVKNDKNDKNKTSLEIKNFRLRYSDSELKIIDEYFDILRWTRKSGVIADSIYIGQYKYWEKYSIPKVIYGLKTYIGNPKHHDKRENYTNAIIRNATAEQVTEQKETKPKRVIVDQNPFLNRR